MIWHRFATVSICLGCLPGTAASQPDVEIGSEFIRTGSKIEVFGPGPDLQQLIDDLDNERIGAGMPNKPYLIQLGPGEFTITPDPVTSNGLVMAPYISIIGSGQDATVLKGSISSASADSKAAIVTGASNTILSDLKVDNNGNGDYTFAIFNGGGAAPRIERVTANGLGPLYTYAVYNDGASPTMTAVDAIARGITDNAAVYNSNSSSPMMTEVRATGSGGMRSFGVYNDSSSPTMVQVTASAFDSTDSYGIYNDSSSPLLTKVTATAFDASNYNSGIHNISSSPVMNAVTATASGGTFGFGVYNESSSPTMTEVRATTSGASTADYGLYLTNDTSTPQVQSSRFSGTTNGVFFNGSEGTRIADSQIIGGIDGNPPGVQCRNVMDVGLGDITC